MDAELSSADRPAWVTDKKQKRPPLLAFYLSLVPVGVVSLIVAMAVTTPAFREQIPAAAPWVVALFFAEMFPVPVWRDIRVSLGFPMVMFLAVLFEPATVAAVALVGSGDPREFTGGSDFLRSVFNRSQVALAGFAASAVFHGIAGEPQVGPLAIGAAVLASSTQLGINMTLVGLAARIDYRVPLRSVIRRMPVGTPWLFETAYLGVGVLGAVMALIYLEVGIWAMVGLVPPLVAVRHLIKTSARLEQAEARLARETALKHVADQLAGDRHTERERLASALHDEVSPLVASSNLSLESVVRRLNEADPEIVEDIRRAMDAGRSAQALIRSLIGRLLQSPTGPHGLAGALLRMLEEIGDSEGVAVRHDLEPLDAPQTINELLFAAAREAARNAIAHGGARSLDVALHEDAGTATLSVADDGKGFEPEMLDLRDDRYGLRLLRQRAESCGGRLSVVSAPGRGTVVSVEIPVSASSEIPERSGSDRSP